MTSFDRYYATPTPRNACLLAADNHAAQAIKDWGFISHLRDASELCEDSARLAAINTALADALHRVILALEVDCVQFPSKTIEQSCETNSATLAQARKALALNSQLKG